jgi:hypothetical protein
MVTLNEHAGFLDEAQFRAAHEAIKGANAYDQCSTPFTISLLLDTLVWAAQAALRPPDWDCVACGVCQGDMAEVVRRATDFGASR